MKFNSRKDILFQTLIFGFCGLLITLLLFRIFNAKESGIIDFFILLPISLLLWIHFGTKYKLTQTELKYKSGPIYGKIEIKQIREIIKGKTLWVGLKPATARKGLIIKYDKHKELYISPKTNDSFVEKVLEINKTIIITPSKNVKHKN